MPIVKFVRNLLTPLEWTLLAIVVFVFLIGTISFMDGVLECGSEGYGPAAPQTCGTPTQITSK